MSGLMKFHMDSTGFTEYDLKNLIDSHQGTGEWIEYLNETETGRTLAVYFFSLLGTWKIHYVPVRE